MSKKSLSIYQHDSYREVLRESLNLKKKHFGTQFTFEKMAKTCRLQRTWLSSVLAGKGNLSADQLFMACRFLQMSDKETQFTTLLLERERSVFEEHRAKLDKQIKATRDEELSTDSYIGARQLPTAASDAMTAFYLDFNAQVIHMFLTVPKFRGDLERVRQSIGIERAMFQASLAKVEAAGLIGFEGEKVVVLRDSFHLPPSSALYFPYRMQMRLKGMEFASTRPPEDQYGFSVLYSASKETREKILTRFLEFVEWCQTLTQKGEPTGVYQMNFDLLTWGGVRGTHD